MAVNFGSLRPLEGGETPGLQGRIPQVEFEEFEDFFPLELFTFFYFFQFFSESFCFDCSAHTTHSTAELPCSRDENT